MRSNAGSATYGCGYLRPGAINRAGLLPSQPRLTENGTACRHVPQLPCRTKRNRSAFMTSRSGFRLQYIVGSSFLYGIVDGIRPPDGLQCTPAHAASYATGLHKLTQSRPICFRVPSVPSSCDGKVSCALRTVSGDGIGQVNMLLCLLPAGTNHPGLLVVRQRDTVTGNRCHRPDAAGHITTPRSPSKRIRSPVPTRMVSECTV